MVYRLIISYDGGAYAGWQRQKNAITVQQRIEDAVADLIGTDSLRIHGAGRTDAGVHARGQVAHLELPSSFDLTGLVHGTNHRLPADLRLLAADRMGDDFHARRSAVAKEYRYRVLHARVASPLDGPYVMCHWRSLDIATMRLAASLLIGRHDFSAFALAGGGHSQPWRRLLAATVDSGLGASGREVRFRFVGVGFLRGMVRALVGTLLEVGRGSRTVADFARLLEPGRSRSDAGFSAEARGLVLHRVFYPPQCRPLEHYDPSATGS